MRLSEGSVLTSYKNFRSMEKTGTIERSNNQELSSDFPCRDQIETKLINEVNRNSRAISPVEGSWLSPLPWQELKIDSRLRQPCSEHKWIMCGSWLGRLPYDGQNGKTMQVRGVDQTQYPMIVVASLSAVPQSWRTPLLVSDKTDNHEKRKTGNR